MEYLLNIEHLIGLQIIPIAVFFIIATYTDIKDYKIYNWTTGGLALFNTLYFILLPILNQDYKTALIHTVGGFLSFALVLGVAMHFLIKMGGDIKFAAAAGIAFGGIRSILWILLSAFIGGIHGIYKMKVQGKDKNEKIPFAPYFLIGAIVYILLYFAF